VPDRTEAIRAALREAGSGDVVLVAGKGHEDYQQIGDRRIPYSDRDTVRTLLREAA
ncbi:MAG TPA: UDP-N-acetylmuramoyl-L-alanyl-D-glutamate--2,6-diaminopimelate ligase, partial [Gammaproteobacteria bacterium]|nr:UDP-N-acetylmuramoyl-L-alanyl-D-glutamate--2,6-diaminopimelate ligase [Gammaproteobacteria bacterium]